MSFICQVNLNFKDYKDWNKDFVNWIMKSISILFFSFIYHILIIKKNHIYTKKN